MRLNAKLLSGIRPFLPVQSPLAKIFYYARRANHFYNSRVLSHKGAWRNVINAGRDAVDAASALDETR